MDSQDRWPLSHSFRPQYAQCPEDSLSEPGKNVSSENKTNRASRLLFDRHNFLSGLDPVHRTGARIYPPYSFNDFHGEARHVSAQPLLPRSCHTLFCGCPPRGPDPLSDAEIRLDHEVLLLCDRWAADCCWGVARVRVFCLAQRSAFTTIRPKKG